MFFLYNVPHQPDIWLAPQPRNYAAAPNYGNYTIQAISEDVGYKSSTSFILAFKRIVGMTPSVYQKLAKERLEAAETAPAPDSPADAR